MKNMKIGLVTTALLCLCLMMLSGCSASAPLYTAGLTEETAAGVAASGTEADGSAGSGAESDGFSGSGTEPDADGTRAVSEAGDGSAVDTDGTKTVNTEEAAASYTLAGLNTSGEEASQTETITGYVYVCGAVNEPGVYPIRADMRVCDAVELAGGFSPEADEEWLNQAAAVCDGQKLYIYTVEETDLMRESGMVPEGMSGSTSDAGVSGISGSASGKDAAAGTSADTSAETSSTDAGASEAGMTQDGKININTATREQLMTLPGIGESKADAIVSYRDTYGAFASIEEIQNISGIKSGVFSQIKDLITV
ncbi:MAG: ComEA family DNA-binding protein [Lachnospiraceae bacterium]|nr:ComEA family DNA-binding protein [Lachnospiraceae bacterium]